MQKNEDGSRRISLVGGLGSYEDNGYLVLSIVKCSNENAMFIKGMINHHILPSCLLCSQSICLKIQLQSYHSSDYFSGYSLQRVMLRLTPVHLSGLISQSCYMFF